MKRTFLFPTLLIALAVAACNVPAQPPMPETPSVWRAADFRTTPAGGVGRTNFFLTNGKKPEVYGFFVFSAPSNTNLVVDMPVIFATECDVKQIQYEMSWVLKNDGEGDFTPNIEDHFTPLVFDHTDPTKTIFVSEATGKFEFRVHLTNIDQCQRISFKFNAFETPGYTPLTKNLAVSTDGNTQANLVTARTVYMQQATHLFTLKSDHVQTFSVVDSTLLPELATSATCHHTPQFSLQTTDSKNVVVVTPLAGTPSAGVTFTTDPTKTNALLVAIQKGPGCQNEPYAFAVKEVMKAEPSPSPTASPDPAASPTPSPSTP